MHWIEKINKFVQKELHDIIQKILAIGDNGNNALYYKLRNF